MNTLQLYIWKDDSIRNIQEKFSDLFPGLQIKIFKHVDGKNSIHGQNFMFCPEVKMIEINPGFRDGMLPVSGSLTVSDLEQAIFEEFGLFAQVFRKNGNPMEETSRMKNYLSERAEYPVNEGFPTYREPYYFHQIQFGYKLNFNQQNQLS
jgi:hypothetical protein